MASIASPSGPCKGNRPGRRAAPGNPVNGVRWPELADEVLIDFALDLDDLLDRVATVHEAEDGVCVWRWCRPETGRK
jgi:hypothetical protein